MWIWVLILTYLAAMAEADRYPEHVHLAFGDDSRTMHITWSTRKDPGDALVQFGIKDSDVEKEVGETKSIRATTTLLVPGIFPNTKQFVHKAVLRDLQPDTEYWYRCGSSGLYNWGLHNYFRTQPEGTNWSPRLAIFGDLGATNHKILHRLIDEVRRKKLDAVLHAGDIAYDLHSDEGRVGDKFLQAIEPVASQIPYMVAPGNHEAFRNFTNYKVRFNMPGEFDNMMYSFQMGPVLIIALNTEAYYLMERGGRETIRRQNKWLTNLLREANLNRREVPWIIAFGHRPMYCSNNILRSCATGNTRVRGNRPLLGKGLEAILYEHGVDALFWGHQHSYERMYPVYNKRVFNGTVDDPYNNPRAPVHFIAGCAGNGESLHSFMSNPPAWSAYRSLTYGYVQLTATNKSHLNLQYLSNDIDGKPVDEVWIQKDSHGPYPFMFPQNLSKEDEE